MTDRQTDRLTDRAFHIDLIESIAIFFVIVYHTTIYFFDFTQDNSLLNYVLYYFRTILSTCVPLFFFVNGYLLLNKEFILKKHIIKTIRLIILTLVWAIILMPTYMIIDHKPLSLGVIFKSILNLDMAWGMNLFWFMGALICIYILFPALKALFDANKKAFMFFVAACFVLTFGVVFGSQVITVFGEALHISNKQTLRSFLYHPMLTMINPFRGSYGYSFVYFCIGGLIYSFEDRILKINALIRNIISALGIIVSCGGLFLIGLFNTSIDKEVWDVVWNGYDTIFTLINVICIYILSLNYRKNLSVIRLISCNTLGIYFMHGLFIRLTRPWVEPKEFLCNLPLNLVYALLILFTCLMICIVIRKIPILRKMI